MKFHDLEIGQRFELDGVAYVKTSPMMAGQVEGGGSKFMPRYAMVRLLDEAVPRARAKADRPLSAERVLAAFEAYHAVCASLVAADRQAALAAARQDFIAAIGE